LCLSDFDDQSIHSSTYDPAGKDAYSTFLKKSECRAWRVGETCRKTKLAACSTEACKKYVQKHVDFAGKMVKKYCGTGLSAGAKAAIGVGGGAAVGAGIGALVGAPWAHWREGSLERSQGAWAASYSK